MVQDRKSSEMGHNTTSAEGAPGLKRVQGWILQLAHLPVDGSYHECKWSAWKLFISSMLMLSIQVGYQRPLELNDVWLVNPDRSAEVMTAKLNASFKRRTERGDKRPLVGAMYDTFKAEFILGGACQLVSQLITVLSPFILRYLITFAAEAYYASQFGRPAPAIGRGVGLVIGVTVLQIIQSTCSNQFLYRGMMNGGQARAVLIAVIFDKALRISGRAKAGGKPPDAPPLEIKPGSKAEKKWYEKLLKKKKKGPKVDNDNQGWGNGRIINLMSTDTYRVDQASGMFHMIWTSPIGILLTLVLLIVNLTYSALAGFGLLALTTPLLGRAIRSLFKRRAGINKITDQRVSLTNEVLHAVRFVKYFGWETSFLDRIAAIRKREIRSIQALQSIRNGIMAVAMSMPVFASMLAFITYSLLYHPSLKSLPNTIFCLTVAFCIQALWGQNARDAPKISCPAVLRISPASAAKSEVFPDPTLPMTAISSSRPTVKFISWSLKGSCSVSVLALSVPELSPPCPALAASFAFFFASFSIFFCLWPFDPFPPFGPFPVP